MIYVYHQNVLIDRKDPFILWHHFQGIHLIPLCTSLVAPFTCLISFAPLTVRREWTLASQKSLLPWGAQIQRHLCIDICTTDLLNNMYKWSKPVIDNNIQPFAVMPKAKVKYSRVFLLVVLTKPLISRHYSRKQCWITRQHSNGRHIPAVPYKQVFKLIKAANEGKT